MVQPGKSLVFTLPVEQCPDPTIPVGRPVIRQRSNGRQDLAILRLLVVLAGDSLREDAVKRGTRDAERVGDRLHSGPSSSNDGNREISFFVRNLYRFPEDQKVLNLA